MPGWILLLSGLALLGVTLLAPAWTSQQQLVWQRDVMQAQFTHLQAQQQRYAEFYEAIQNDDPVLLEHLAYTQMRFKPAGKQLLEMDRSERMEQLSASIAAWLHKPLPRVGRQIEPLMGTDTALTRLTTGSSRFVLYAVAIGCLGTGLASRGVPTIRGLNNSPHEP